ncbi:unnamed protein product [Gordionus sp. m RMFG-2023]
MHYIFVYGTLKSNEPNNYRLFDTNNGIAQLHFNSKTRDKWPLIIATNYNIPFLLNQKGIGEYIDGEIYLVDDQMMSYLDKFEHIPHDYERLQIDVISPDSNKDLKCWTYLRTKPIVNKLEQNNYLKSYTDSDTYKYIKHDNMPI